MTPPVAKQQMIGLKEIERGGRGSFVDKKKDCARDVSCDAQWMFLSASSRWSALFAFPLLRVLRLLRVLSPYTHKATRATINITALVGRCTGLALVPASLSWRNAACANCNNADNACGLVHFKLASLLLAQAPAPSAEEPHLVTEDMEGGLFNEKDGPRSFKARACVDANSWAKMYTGKPICGVADGSPMAKLKRTNGGGSSLTPTKQRPPEPPREAALRVFLLNEQSCPVSSRWLESTKSLSLASMQLCEQCRETVPVDVRVEGETPRSVWEPRGPSSIAEESSEMLVTTTTTTRVPPVKIAKLASDMPYPAELLGSLACTGVFRWLSEVTFGGASCLCVSGVTWPKKVRALTFNASFSHPVSEVTWPSGLERLALEGDFNQEIVGVSWPAGLKAVTFGKTFNQPVDGVVWPDGLDELTFGHAFNQAINHVGQRALGLKKLALGWQFDQSLDSVALPKKLEVLSIVGVYNRPFDRVLLPPGLKALTLGGHFDNPLSSTLLPKRLEFLSLGWAFNHPLDRVDWPAGLTELALGYRFNQPASCVAFPPRMEKLEIGVFSRQSLKGLAWPPSLKWLTVGRAFDVAGGTLPEGARVCRRGHTFCKVRGGGQELIPRT